MRLRYLPTNARPAWELRLQGNFLITKSVMLWFTLGERYMRTESLIFKRKICLYDCEVTDSGKLIKSALPRVFTLIEGCSTALQCRSGGRNAYRKIA